MTTIITTPTHGAAYLKIPISFTGEDTETPAITAIKDISLPINTTAESDIPIAATEEAATPISSSEETSIPQTTINESSSVITINEKSNVPIVATEESNKSVTITEASTILVTTTEEATTVDKNSKVERLVVAIIFVSFIFLVIADSFTNTYIKDGIDSFLEWMEENPNAGVFASTGVYFVATVLFVPGSILTLGSGFVFANAFGLVLGVLLSTIAVFVGASMGAIADFLLGRYLMRDWVESTLTKKYPLFAAMDGAMQKEGLRIMTLLRLSPIIPFNALNYIAGVTGVQFIHYVYALIAMLPGTALFAFVGASAGSLGDCDSGVNKTVTIVTIVAGVVFGVFGIGVMSYYAKKELDYVIIVPVEDDDDNDECESKV